MSLRVAILTVSDGVSAGAREDRGGPAVEEALARSGVAHRVVVKATIPDGAAEVSRALAEKSHGMSGRDLQNWIARAEQKAVQRAILQGGPQHFILNIQDLDRPPGCH